ncbi:MAG: non-ribosomal peptide synthetase, partial [Tahibacter sp.]
DLDLLSDAERRQLLVEWNQTSTDYPHDRRIETLFAEQAARTPQAPALHFPDGILSYQDLEQRSNCLAHYLIQRGMKRGVRIGLSVERNAAMVVALLAILKTGGSYVPLDPDYPMERLAFIVRDAQIALVLTQESLRERYDGHGDTVIYLDTDWTAIADCPTRPLSLSATEADDAYVIYTSGSTGTPKGVAVGHAAVTRLVLGSNYIAVSDSDRVAQLASISFDAATFEVWGALLNGACLVGVDRETSIDPTLLSEFIHNESLSVMFLTTALFNQVARVKPDGFNSLRSLLFGGEQVDPSAVASVLKAGGPARLLHVYGPTECTTFATWYRVDTAPLDAQTVPIGRALSNTSLYVLDQQMLPVPIGVPGELYIGGPGVARGYVNQPALTAERFVVDPYGQSPSASRLYRSGDRVKWRADGNLEFLGRFDHQVKIRGFRIELGEIEAALHALPQVDEALLVVDGDALTGRRLVAYVGARASVNAVQLRDGLRRTLPDYMLPSAFVILEALPLTHNGKIDRKALPAVNAAGAAQELFVAASTPVELELVTIWSEVLRLEQIGVHDNFFEIGGHSLLATQVVVRIRERLNVKLPILRLFETPTIHGLAAYVEMGRQLFDDNEAMAGQLEQDREEIEL